MKPHDLKPAPGAHKRAKRVGRGEASGKGKTAGRGTKGTRARGSIKPHFEGGQMPLARRVPKLKGFKPPKRTEYGVVNVSEIADVEGDRIGPDELRAAGLVRKRDKLIKVLGEGDISSAKTVAAHAFSSTARSKIEAAGGTVEVLVTGPEGASK
ncbi:MAG: 50S ribosomal protein L15 [Actinomycetota bacterium]|nr:50S ribosomal protein L15 [Actinomycetota bacterium]